MLHFHTSLPSYSYIFHLYSLMSSLATRKYCILMIEDVDLFMYVHVNVWKVVRVPLVKHII